MKLDPYYRGRDSALGWLVCDHINKATPGGLPRPRPNPYKGLKRRLLAVAAMIILLLLFVTFASRAFAQAPPECVGMVEMVGIFATVRDEGASRSQAITIAIMAKDELRQFGYTPDALLRYGQMAALAIDIVYANPQDEKDLIVEGAMDDCLGSQI